MNHLPVHPFIALLFLVFALPAFAAPTKYVAVFETVAADQGVATPSELLYLSNELRKIALEVLPPKAGYTVMTRGNIYSLLPPDKETSECFEGKCLVDVGRNIGADYAAQGTVLRFGGMLTFSMECYETMGGGLIGSFTAESADINGLLGAVRNNAAKMFGKIAEMREAGDSSQVAVPLIPEPPPATPPVVPPSAPPPPVEVPVVAEPEPEPVAPIVVLDTVTIPQEPPQSIDPQVAGEPQKSHWNHWVGGILDVAGAGLLIAGLYQNSVVSDEYSAYSDAKTQPEINDHREACDNAKSERNTFYGVGLAVLAGGLVFHFVF
jgi:hypothetical protein